MASLEYLPWRAARAEVRARQKDYQIRKLSYKHMPFDYWIGFISPKLTKIVNVEVCVKRKIEMLKYGSLRAE